MRQSYYNRVLQLRRILWHQGTSLQIIVLELSGNSDIRGDLGFDNIYAWMPALVVDLS